MDASIGIGSETRTVLAGAADQFQRTVLKHAVKGQHIISRQTKDMANAIVGQPVDEIGTNRQPLLSWPSIHDRPTACAMLGESAQGTSAIV